MLSMLRCCTNRITSSTQIKIYSRRYMTVSEKMEILLKQRDHVPHHYKLIYRDKNQFFVGASYHAINFLGWSSVAVVGYLWYNDIPVQKKAKHFTLLQDPVECVELVIGISALVIMSIWLRNRYALRVYFSEKEQMYRAIFMGHVPYTCENFNFPANSLSYVSKDSAFPWRNTIFRVNKRKMYLFEDNFRTHSDFLQMLKPGEI